jgi:hypothetical protein
MNFLSQLVDASARFQSKYAAHLINRFQYVPCPSVRVPLESLWVEPRGLTAALANPSPLVITGAPGAGKTTTLSYLALSLAREMLHHAKPRVPLFFSARDLNPSALPRITDFPRELNLSQDAAAHCPRVFFPEAFSTGRAVVLIDDADALSPDQLQAWLRELQGARVILAAPAPIAGLTEFRLPGFRDNDLEKFAVQWHRENAAAFLAALKTNGVPRALTSNPQSLTLLAHGWREDKPLPQRRTELYDAFVDHVLGDSDETTLMLEGVALAMQRGKPASNEFLPKAKGFLRLAKNRTTEFAHDLWQAYFAARALRHSPSIEPLAEHLSESAWREVVLFYAGLGDANELTNRLIAQDDYAFAGHVVAHAREVKTELRDVVTKELIARAWDGDRTSIDALAEMQSDAAVDALAAKLKDKDPAIRARAAQLLGALQLDRGIEYLLPQLRDVNADVRDNVVEALGRSRTDRVIEPLLVALRGDSRVGVADKRLRVAAAKALGEVASDKAVPALIVDLQLGEPEVRAVVADALKRIKSPLLIKPLQGIAVSGDQAARQFAAEILAVIDGKD